MRASVQQCEKLLIPERNAFIGGQEERPDSTTGIETVRSTIARLIASTAGSTARPSIMVTL
jgi:hypothetical protein